MLDFVIVRLIDEKGVEAEVLVKASVGAWMPFVLNLLLLRRDLEKGLVGLGLCNLRA